jgi:dienelactone hydrolase
MSPYLGNIPLRIVPFMFYTSLLAIFLITSSLSAIHAPYVFQSPSIDISLEKSLLDQEINIIIGKLYHKEIISIQANTIDDNGIKWVSNASFEANNCGVVDLALQSPIAGSYEGIDPIGLLWSMQPESGNPSSFKVKREEYSVTLRVFRDKQEVASKDIIRLRKSPEVKQIPIKENGLVGILFIPPSEKPLPVIITLSGSNGGLGENRAQLLASHGFAVLALSYFGVEGLPTKLQDIPLEYFETAFNWIKAQSNLDNSHVGIYGASRGGELALILGAWFPESVQSIVAVVPSSVIYGGLSETPVHAWQYRGKPLAPFAPVPPTDFTNGRGDDAANPANTLNSFLEGMKNEKEFDNASIPVEKIQASLLIISGGDDQMWPSSIYATQIEKRLQKHHSRIYRKHLHYPKAGHGINIPNLPQSDPIYYHPIGKKWFSMGGTIAEDQRASKDSWQKLIEFFDKTLESQR